MHRRPFAITAFASAAISLFTGCESPAPARILVFSKTAGYRHESIAVAKPALQKLGVVFQSPSLDLQEAPPPGSDAVSPSKGIGHRGRILPRVGVPLGRRTDRAVRRLRLPARRRRDGRS